MPTVTTPAKYRNCRSSYYWSAGNPSVRYKQYDQQVDVSYGSNVRTTNSNPSWRVQVAKNVNASTNYLVEKHSLQLPRVAVKSWVYSTPYPWLGENLNQVNVGVLPSIYTADDSATMDLALARLKRKLSSNVGNMNALVPLAELKDLRGLIRNSADLAASAVGALIDLRKKTSHGNKSVQKFAADIWLEFSFGVSPLIADTKAVAESINKYLLRENRSLRLSGTASKTWSSGSKGSVSSSYGAGMDYDWHAKHTLSYRYVAGFNLQIGSANNYGIGEQLGLEFGSLPSVAWELVPYSWIADYFTTVGAYLDDAFVTPPGDTEYVIRNRRYLIEAVGAFSHSPADANSKVLWQQKGSGKWTFFSFSRTSLSNLPHRTLRFKTVDEMGLHAVNKLLNLTSLLVR